MQGKAICPLFCVDHKIKNGLYFQPRYILTYSLIPRPRGYKGISLISSADWKVRTVISRKKGGWPRSVVVLQIKVACLHSYCHFKNCSCLGVYVKQSVETQANVFRFKLVREPSPFLITRSEFQKQHLRQKVTNSAVVHN